MNVDLIGIPFDGYGRTGHHDVASAVLRDAALLDAEADHAIATARR